MKFREVEMPSKYHQAVESWRDIFLPDHDLLLEKWQKYFPRDPAFKLCAYRECGMCGEIECGDSKGQDKHSRAADMDPEQAGHILGAIRAQASTEFGSIQQHQLTLSRAQDEQDQFWILRMMAEELRHGYQMLHLLVEDDWSVASAQSSADMVEEILSMRTGSHVLGAFNVDFDSFVDNIVFCALIDRVGKYQLSMQKVSAYAPMGESMPPMLREEAFHLATGVLPLRRWVEQAANDSVYVTMDLIQRTLNKWLPRGLEMFGHEKGGATNVRYGFKPMVNAEAQQQYYDEVGRLVSDLNLRYLRARLPKLSHAETVEVCKRLLEDDDVVDGVERDDLLLMPVKEFFRRRGLPAFTAIGHAGEVFDDIDDYARHLKTKLPQTYSAGRDFKGYIELLRQVSAGTISANEAAARTPNLSRVGGVCPCSRAVRWVTEGATADSETASTSTSTPA